LDRGLNSQGWTNSLETSFQIRAADLLVQDVLVSMIGHEPRGGMARVDLLRGVILALGRDEPWTGSSTRLRMRAGSSVIAW
jgi:hypothetical protein